MDAHGFIQWKGTNACMDINCSCGKLTHVDAGFLYYVKCPYCGAVYELGSTIEFKPVSGPTPMEPHLGEKSENPEDDDR